MPEIYDLAIIGGGPAGLTAGLYASRAHLKTILFEGQAHGGRIAQAHWVDNYPGFPSGVSGYDLGRLMAEQAGRFGVIFENSRIERLERAGEIFSLAAAGGLAYASRAVIAAVGVRPRTLDIPGEREFLGQGVSYCATCDAPLYRGAEVAVIGGGSSALTESLHLAKFARKVHLIHRRGQFRAEPILGRAVGEEPAIETHLGVTAREIYGEKGAVCALRLHNLTTNQDYTIKLSGVFMMIGYHPQGLEFLAPWVDTDTSGFIATDDVLRTKTEGLWAAGDARAVGLRQVVTAVRDGALAAVGAQQFLEARRAR